MLFFPELRSCDAPGGKNGEKKSIFVNKCAPKVVEKRPRDPYNTFEHEPNEIPRMPGGYVTIHVQFVDTFSNSINFHRA